MVLVSLFFSLILKNSNHLKFGSVRRQHFKYLVLPFLIKIRAPVCPGRKVAIGANWRIELMVNYSDLSHQQ